MTAPGALEAQLQAALAGTYRIDRELGRGAMARVFLAEDLRHKRAVAVKLLPPETATPDSAERFLREIRITAGLQHPNILPLIDSGAATGLCWYVMPYIEGESIRTRLAQGHLPLLEATRYAIEVARALAYAHSQSIIHRDIKPENIMLSGGRAIITDFGLGRAVKGDAARLTAMGLPLGTPAYMSPELIQGEDADERSDIYGLGCVYYEMITGRLPFIGSLAEVLRQHVNATPSPPSRYRPGLPSQVDQVSLRALAKSRAERYASANDFANDLERIAALATLETTAAPPQEKKKGAFQRLLDKLGGG
jgi:serine/threonine-protein kinase